MAVKTWDQVVAMKAKAVRFVQDVLGKPDRASEIEEESVQEYADRKKILIENPVGKSERGDIMAGTMTKDELEELLDQVGDKLDEALDPKLSREQLVELVEEASDLIEGDEELEEEEELEENPAE